MNLSDVRKGLVDFMLWKNEQILKATGIVYCDSIDIGNIRKWNDFEILNVGRLMRFCLHDYFTSDSTICPFCMLCHGHCTQCEYGANHGYCDESVSNYAKIITYLKQKENTPSIYHFLGKKNIKAKLYSFLMY